MPQPTNPSSTDISSLLTEERTFAPPAAFTAAAHVSDPAVYDTAAKDPEAFWAGFANELEWIKPFTKVLEWKSPDAKWFAGGQLNVSANCLDRHVRTARRNKAAIIWEGEPGDRRTLTYFDLLPRRERVRARAARARRQEGRPRRDLHAADPRAGDRDARLRPDRRPAQRRLRRLQRGVAARPHQRLAVHGAGHRRRRLSPRPARAAEADGRRGLDRTRRRSGTSSSCSAIRRRASRCTSRRAATTGTTG